MLLPIFIAFSFSYALILRRYSRWSHYATSAVALLELSIIGTVDGGNVCELASFNGSERWYQPEQTPWQSHEPRRQPSVRLLHTHFTFLSLELCITKYFASFCEPKSFILKQHFWCETEKSTTSCWIMYQVFVAEIIYTLDLMTKRISFTLKIIRYVHSNFLVSLLFFHRFLLLYFPKALLLLVHTIVFVQHVSNDRLHLFQWPCCISLHVSGGWRLVKLPC